MATTINSGVYTITNTKNGRVYVGSTVNLKTREIRHFTDLLRGMHANSMLQRSFNKHGAECFRFDVIERCEPSDLLNREQHWIDNKRLSCRLYNLAPKAYSCLGIKRSDITKRRMSDAKKGKTFSAETREQMSLAKLGNSHRKGKKASEKTKKRISDAKKGTIVSEQTKNLLSEVRKGNKNAQGHKQTPETIRKRVEARRLTLEKRKLGAIA